MALLTLLLLRNVRGAKDLQHRLVKWAEIWRQVWKATDGREALTILVRYVMLANEAISIQDIRQALVETIGLPAGEVVMTLGERLIAQGRKEGEAKGEAKGRAQALLAVLHARELEVSDAARDRILACTDVAVLDRWLARVVSCSQTGELFD